MTEGELVRNRRHVAAEITSIVCNSVRATADALADELGGPEFDERADRQEGCFRLAEEVRNGVSREIVGTLGAHSLSDSMDEVGFEVIRCVGDALHEALRYQTDDPTTTVTEETVVQSIEELALVLEQNLQQVFDVWDDPDLSARRSQKLATSARETRENLAGRAVRLMASAWRSVGKRFG